MLDFNELDILCRQYDKINILRSFSWLRMKNILSMANRLIKNHDLLKFTIMNTPIRVLDNDI
jgi:hypothetical protein